MRIIKFVGYLFYRYYSKGATANIPYFSTICAMALLGYMHFFQLLILINKINLITISTGDNKLTKRIIIFFAMLPIYFVMTRLFRKSDIELLKKKYDYNSDKIFSGRIWLIIYIVLSFSMIFILVTLKRK